MESDGMILLMRILALAIIGTTVSCFMVFLWPASLFVVGFVLAFVAILLAIVFLCGDY